MERYIYWLLLSSVRVLILYGLTVAIGLCTGIIWARMSVVTVIKVSCNIALMVASLSLYVHE
jgi:hypothetical protein